jgi:putative membrane protein
MQKLILRWAINVIALYIAVGTGWIPGIRAENTSWLGIIGLALVFTVVNALVRPLLKFVTCPVILLTLGLFTLVINGAMFALTGAIGQWFNIGFSFTAPWPSWQWAWTALLGGLVVGVVSAVLTLLLKDELRNRR